VLGNVASAILRLIPVLTEVLGRRLQSTADAWTIDIDLPLTDWGPAA